MHEIFISYSSQHRDLTRALADAIEAQYGAGSVWLDEHALESWGDYEIQIRNALNEAKVVVVIWTKVAGESDWVKSEAGRANSAGKLVNVRASDTAWRDVPSPYDQHHFKNLDDIEGILKTIASVLTGNLQRTAVPLHEIYFRHHGRLLIDPKQSRLARDPREISPTDLLQAKYAVVPYVDVTGMKADLLAWCRDGARATAGRLVHGPGGLGKTRLMIEVAAALRHEGWMAGFFDRPHEQVLATLQQRWQGLDQLIAHGDDAGLLMVMDYAEARQDEVKAIAERLSRHPDHDTRPIRLVLLTRSAGEWWTTLHDETPEIQRLFRRDARGPGVIAMQAIATPEQRRELFFESTQAMAPTLREQGYVLPTSQPSLDRLRRIERDAGHARPLAVQMEALLWLASAAPEAGAIGVDGLLQRVLGLERAHWRKLLGALDDDRVREIARGVAQATAVQSTNSKPSTERLLMADRFYGDQRKSRVAVDSIVRDLSRMYGKPDGGVTQLEPDLIGEHHVATTGDDELIDGCLDWIGTEPEDVRAKRRRDFLTVLQRATQPEHGATADRAAGLLDHLVRSHVKALAPDMVAVMVDTPGALLHRLEQHLDSLDDETLAAINAALPLQSLVLMELSLQVATRCADFARKMSAAADAASDFSPDDHEALLRHLAARVGTLGTRLSNVGRREDALAATQEAGDIFRRLVEIRPDAFLPDLAMSLNNLGNGLSNLGRREEALAASQEALDIYRCLAAIRPDAFLPNLAAILDNLGRHLSDLGRREEALAASQEALDIYRRLAKTRPDTFLSDLAFSLNNLGVPLSALGRRAEALAASQAAVEIYRRLAEARPDAFLPNLANSLNNSAVILSDLGCDEAALAASQESVDIRRRLAETRPDAFLPDLAASLINVGRALANHNGEEALAASRKAVDIYRGLAVSRPGAFLPDLAISLNNLGGHLSGLGRHEEALAALQEAVDIRRRLAVSRPDAFLPNLANSLGALGRALAVAGRHGDAAAVAQEGLVTIAPFAEKHAKAFSDLVRALGRTYLAACKKAGMTLDMALLERVGRAGGAGDAVEDGPEIEALKAKVGAIVAMAEKTGALDEAALAKLPAGLADQLRAAWVAPRAASDRESAGD